MDEPRPVKTLRGPKLYLYVNLVVLGLATFSYTVDASLQDRVRATAMDGILVRLLLLNSLAVTRIMAMVRLFEWIETRRTLIHSSKQRTLTDAQRRSIYAQILGYIAVIDAVQFWYAEQHALFAQETWADAVVNTLAFVPKSLCFEIIFDLFHYATHWYCHRNTWLYQNLHKRHHTHTHPCALSTFEQNGLDVLLTNFLPMCVAITVGPRFTPFQLHLQFVYKTYVEVAGHCGLDVDGVSFPQAPMLNELSRVCLEAHDHDLHHTDPSWNFAKRFSVWDKLFGTFRSGRDAVRKVMRKNQ